jgi:hypothetical protein
MDHAPPLGTQVNWGAYRQRRSTCGAALAAGAALLSVILQTPLAFAAERYAVVITGASAGEAYGQKYDTWRASVVATLKQKFQYPDDRLVVLNETGKDAVGRSTRENVRQVFSSLRARLSKDDLLFVLLIGHGTTDDDEAKFNLVGPDMSSGEWADLLKPIPGRLVFIDTTGGSFPFLRRLAAPGRIVLTATDSTAQQFETVFPGFFVKAFEDPTADVDKNGRVSVWEAFSYASAAVRQWFQQLGQLPTERSLLDDNGDGIGREAQNPGSDGTLARAVYLAPESPGGGSGELLQRRAELERQLENLKLRKASSSDPAQYDVEIERILVEIARLSRP